MIPCLRFEIHFCLTERVTDFGRREWEKCNHVNRAWDPHKELKSRSHLQHLHHSVQHSVHPLVFLSLS